jgi:hypothetical protein
LDEAQQSLGGGDIGETLFAVLGRHFQLVTIRHQLTAFLAQPLFQLIPIFSGGYNLVLVGLRSGSRLSVGNHLLPTQRVP